MGMESNWGRRIGFRIGFRNNGDENNENNGDGGSMKIMGTEDQ